MTNIDNTEDFSQYDAFKNHLDGLNFEGYTEQIATEAPRLFAFEWESFRKNYNFKIKEMTVTNIMQGKKYVPGFKLQGRLLTDLGLTYGDKVSIIRIDEGLQIVKV